MAQQTPTDVSQYVALSPNDKITFLPGNNLSNLLINNNSPTRNIVYKIRTTQPLCYVVKPNSGIIEAMNQAKIEINYVPNTVSLINDLCMTSRKLKVVPKKQLTFWTNYWTIMMNVFCSNIVSHQRIWQQVPSANRLHRSEEYWGKSNIEETYF